MKRAILATLVCLAAAQPAKALMLPPAGGCCPTCLCQSKPAQLLVVPAFFPLDTRTDATMPGDWTRINNAGPWVGLIVAGDMFERAATLQVDLHQAPTTSTWTYGYTYTGSGSVPTLTVMNHVQNWNLSYGPSYVKGMFFDVGPTFDPGSIPGVTAAYENAAPSNAFPTNPSFSGFQQYYSSLYTQTHSSYSWEV